MTTRPPSPPRTVTLRLALLAAVLAGCDSSPAVPPAPPGPDAWEFEGTYTARWLARPSVLEVILYDVVDTDGVLTAREVVVNCENGTRWSGIAIGGPSSFRGARVGGEAGGPVSVTFSFTTELDTLTFTGAGADGAPVSGTADGWSSACHQRVGPALVDVRHRQGQP